jgi:hypothetical protein
MTKKTLYIWDGGVFSPPTKVVGKLAFNLATYISSKHDNNVNVEYHFVPTNKYYNKPWVRCIEEKDRIFMLKKLIDYINQEYKVPQNIKFVVNNYDINYGKRTKDPATTLNSLHFFNKNQLENVYLANSIENVIQRVKGYWQNTLELLFKVHIICYDIYSAELIGTDQTENYIYKSINLVDLISREKHNLPKEFQEYFKKHKLGKKDIADFISSKKNEDKFEGLKELIMSRITFLPKQLIPETYKAAAGNRVREELDVYYSSLKNIQNLTTPGIETYITDNNLYEHCKSKYVDKLISKTSYRNSKTRRSKTRRSKTRRSKSQRPKSQHSKSRRTKHS